MATAIIALASPVAATSFADPDADALEIAESTAERARRLKRPQYRGDPTRDWHTFNDWIKHKRALISLAETHYEVAEPWCPTSTNATQVPAQLRVRAAYQIGVMWEDYVASHRAARPRSPKPAHVHIDLPLLEYTGADESWPEYLPPEWKKARRAFAACLSLSMRNAVWTDESAACETWLDDHSKLPYGSSILEFFPSPTRTPSIAIERSAPLLLDAAPQRDLPAPAELVPSRSK
ncbi:hypothetical protein [Polyangium sorediatum]|uniref:Secreted protein n=1 Tax=Polyangium sorediatum TaxID=889274 RepID=A0ABT6NM74_9BACT|nr:hypothetical protein [Polyangium sorediatum]MDI1429420.1 hypothetical protein [Polyangium sorediatum]